jgi:hypothetical protein
LTATGGFQREKFESRLLGPTNLSQEISRIGLDLWLPATKHPKVDAQSEADAHK